MLKEIKSFEINKIYHITLDTNEFENQNYQLDYKNFNKNDLINIYLIDREHGIESNLIIPFNNINNSENKNLYYESINNGDLYYFYYNNSEKIFLKIWGK